MLLGFHLGLMGLQWVLSRLYKGSTGAGLKILQCSPSAARGQRSCQGLILSLNSMNLMRLRGRGFGVSGL